MVTDVIVISTQAYRFNFCVYLHTYITAPVKKAKPIEFL